MKRILLFTSFLFLTSYAYPLASRAYCCGEGVVQNKTVKENGEIEYEVKSISEFKKYEKGMVLIEKDQIITGRSFIHTKTKPVPAEYTIGEKVNIFVRHRCCFEGGEDQKLYQFLPEGENGL